MAELAQVQVGSLEPARFREALEAGEWERFEAIVQRARGALDGRVIWNVNSTASRRRRRPGRG